MTIYNFNQGIGWASSGVEYAQAYRSNIFKKNKQSAKFIFTDMFYENIEGMTTNIGFESDEIIWLYQYFTDIKINPTTFGVSQLESQFSSIPENIYKTESTITYTFSENKVHLTAFLGKSIQGDVIYKTELFIDGVLTQRDYYNYVKIFSEYFKPVGEQTNIYQRRFFNENGSIAYDELLNGEESLFVFSDRTIYSKESLIGEFVKRLDLTNKDIIIIDRSTGMGPAILGSKGPAKVGVVIHAEHFNEPFTTDEKILWNNYYEYQFKNAKDIDFFITATETQKKLLELQFAHYNKGPIKIYTIPVGSLDKLMLSDTRKPYSLITASRLAGEKHLDWLIKAVVEARKEIEGLSLDIYGRGGEEVKLRKLIADLSANNYIQLKGQKDLKEVYKEYTTYVTASTSEGFGLTLLEAVGSGTGMIGFDVRYGNQTFIKDGENGFLIDYVKNDDEKNISELANAIVKIQKLKKNDLGDFQKKSYRIAEKFLTKNIQEMWVKLEKEVLNDKFI